MKLYRVKEEPILKVAGTRIPSNPQQWPTEVMKALKNQHPYVNLSKVATKFDILEPDEKRASGVIVLDGKVAVPFCIRPDNRLGKPEITELDVMFHGEKFAHMNERALRRALADEKGRLYDRKKDGKILGNTYVGHLTGDASPLEYSPSGPTGGGLNAYAGMGLLSKVVSANNVQYLFKYLSTYRGINSMVESLGLNDSLENLRTGLKEVEPPDEFKFIFRSKTGDFVVALPGGDSRIISLPDLKISLGEDFTPIFRRIMSNGWAMIRDLPCMRSVTVSLDNDSALTRMMRNKYIPIQDSGYYRMMTVDGKGVNALVCVREVDFDGQSVRKQVAILPDGRYSYGKVFLGIAGDMAPGDHPTAKSTIGEGKVGCWLDESFSSAVVTPPFKISEVIMMPGKPVILNGMRLDTMSGCSLVILDALVNPTCIPMHHRHTLPPLHEHAYYIPAHMSFIEMSGKVDLADQAAAAEIAKTASRPQAYLMKNAGTWSMWNDQVSHKNMEASQVALKLAGFGADDDVISRVFRMEDMETLHVNGLTKLEKEAEKKAGYKFKNRAAIRMLKQAAEDISESIDQIADDPLMRENLEDPRVMDRILSLQFVSDETLEELVDAEPLFEEVEDKVAKLLMAARQGEDSINEKATQRALKGIGMARNSLANLAVELESKER